jgi:hypothetical protein
MPRFVHRYGSYGTTEYELFFVVVAQYSSDQSIRGALLWAAKVRLVLHFGAAAFICQRLDSPASHRRETRPPYCLPSRCYFAITT